MSKFANTIVFVVLAVCMASLAAPKDLSDYPLQVQIVQTSWNRNSYGTSSGFGYGNLKDGDSLRGFDYTFSCYHPFNPTQGGQAYRAKWKKPESRLVILTAEIGNTTKNSECELKVTMTNLTYAIKDGHLTSLPTEQYNKMVAERKALELAAHPTDTDPAHYPLKIMLLEMDWQPNPAGGFSGTGRGNISTKDNTMGFLFNAHCPGRLIANLSGSSYQGRWEQEPTRLVVLSHSIGDTKEARTCELKTDVRPNNVFVKNEATSTLTSLTQEEYKKQSTRTPPSKQELAVQPASSAQQELSQKGSASEPASAKPSAKLNNKDVISMVSSGLSIEVILVKMNASECAFDTSPEALKQLKTAHVPDRIIIEMIKHPSSH